MTEEKKINIDYRDADTLKGLFQKMEKFSRLDIQG